MLWPVDWSGAWVRKPRGWRAS